ETPVVTMADTRTMSKLLQAPTEGYGDAIVIPAILAENFELKVVLLSLVTLSHFMVSRGTIPILTFVGLTRSLLCLTAGGNLLNCTPRDALTIIENKSKVRTSRNKLVVSKVNTTTSSSLSHSPYITVLTDVVKELVLMNKANQQASVKVVEETCVTCGVPHPYYECLATDSNTFNASAATGTYNQGANPRGDVKAITTQSGFFYDGPAIPPTHSPLPKVVERETEATQDKVQTTRSESTAHVQPPVVQDPILEPDVAL
nr:reverse transcriptase domain-containing protein [Tanacetum cinerariifolium]